MTTSPPAAPPVASPLDVEARSALEGGRRAGHDLGDLLDPELRAVVRAEGVDPQRDTATVRRLAQEVVRRHDERSLSGVVAPVGDPAGLVDELVARVAGFGPLQRHLDDPDVEEI